ncbi:MAG: cyclic nucleotide-binding domain-containing protein [Deltaproteobacteria bacterium]|nr:MAG: cyclic nucleotide-binding domain-containing protein [Deltaproteobacteria bacterium]
MPIHELLKDVYFFKNFSTDELKLIEPICVRTKYAAQHLIFNSGDPASKMFLIEVGTVNLIKNNKIIASIGKGGMFGEMPFLDDGNRSTSAQTLEETHLIEIPYIKMAQLLLNNPETALKFYTTFARYVSKRLRNTLEE